MYMGMETWCVGKAAVVEGSVKNHWWETGMFSCVGEMDHAKGCSQPRDLLGTDPLLSSLTWLLVGFSPLCVVGLRASVSCWLLAGSLPPFLATWAPPQGSSHHGNWLLLKQLNEGERRPARWKPESFYTFFFFYNLGVASHHSKRGD